MGRLTLLITGASGRVGRACVAEALSRGHIVRSLHRSGTMPDQAEATNLTRFRADLATDDLTTLVKGVDTILHCAAAMRGNDAQMHRDTIAATDRLMAAALPAGVRHIVLASSVSIYGLKDLPDGSVITEETPLENDLAGRDAYTRAKLAQEQSVVAGGCASTVLRIGAIWGPRQLWNAHLGLAKGPVLLRIGRDGQIPLTHIDRAASAMVLAAELGPTGANPLNILDDDLPDRLRYVNALQAGGWPKLVLPVSWHMFDHAARLLSSVPLRPPGLLRAAALRARMRPVAWSGEKAKTVLALPPQIGFEGLMEQALNAEGMT